MIASRRDLLFGLAATASAVFTGCDAASIPSGRQGVRLWFTYGGKNRETLEKLVKEFNDSQSEFWIHAVFQGDYYEGLAKLRTALAAGVAPDLSHVIGEVVPYLAEARVLEVLDGYPGAEALDVLPALGQAGSWVDGDAKPLVALPFNRSTPIAYLNGKLFDEQRLAAPRSWDELRQVALALTVRSGKATSRYGFGCPISWWFWVAMLGQASGAVVEPDGRVSLGDEAGVEALRFWQRLVSEDRVMKPPPGRDYDAWQQTNQDFLVGRTAMIWTSTAFLKYLEENADFPVRAAPLPAFRRRAVPTGGTHWVVLRAAPEAAKRAAWEFLRFMHTPSAAIAWSTSTGYLPVTLGAVRRLEAEGYYAAHPNARVAYDQLDVAEPWPWSTDLFRIQREVVQPRLEEAVLAGADAGQVMAQARRAAAEEV